MVNVAIAGGNGGVGRAICDALQRSTKHKAFVLTRKVDYTDVAGLTAILEDLSIHTIISTFHISGPSLSISQLNLIEAAEASECTKRFAPSAFAIPYPREFVTALPPLKYYFEAIDILKASDLEWTVFLNGVFLDYYGMPHIKTYLAPNVFAIDMVNKVAAIPGDGNTPVTFTWSMDLAKFVVAALDLPSWEEESCVVGDEVTFNQFVDMAEEVCGVKFARSYDSVARLKAGEITELPGHLGLYADFPKPVFQRFMAIFEMWTIDGTSTISARGRILNAQFPDIRTLTAREMLDTYWSKG
ncbi:nmrA-like family protein [Aureobasidium pullulans]|nr:nmrA-like family protein [Aureobasidium pullulans]